MSRKQEGRPEDAGDHNLERACHEHPKKTFREARTCNESEIASPGMTVRPQIADESGPDDTDSSHMRQGRAPNEGSRSIMTIDDICTELGIARSTFHHWRVTGRGPRTLRLPNKSIRVLRDEFLHWLRSMLETRS